MKNFLRNIIFLILLLLVVLPCLALEFDLSVDEEIRKNYNPSKLELENLPPLPNVKPSNTGKTPPSQSIKPVNNLPDLTPAESRPIITNIQKETSLKLKSGTKFTVKSYQGFSDSTRVGTRISFVSQKPVYQKYVTIPQGTVFKGEIVDSHTPQMSGNGGLIVLKIDSMTYKGSTVGVNAKITKANNKKVFVNNIKGKRKYWKNVSTQVNKGENFYRKSRRTSSKFANHPLGVIIAPVPTVVGMGGYAVNLVGSPLVSLFKSGDRISLPAGSTFEIKLLDDVYLY